MINWDNLIQSFLEKNKHINLSAIRDSEWVMIKHIQDSLELEKIINWKEWMKIADIWTWWWFPLIKNVQMIWSRIEDIKNKKFDLVTARAVAYSDKLLNRAFPLIKKWWKIALMKQVNNEEKRILLSEAEKRNLFLEKEYNYKLFDWDIDRVIYVLWLQ